MYSREKQHSTAHPLLHAGSLNGGTLHCMNFSDLQALQKKTKSPSIIH